jgi:hypothetical protein
MSQEKTVRKTETESESAQVNYDPLSTMMYFMIIEYISTNEQVRQAIKDRKESGEFLFTFDNEACQRWLDSLTEKEQWELVCMANLVYSHIRMMHQRNTDDKILPRMVDLKIIRPNGMLTEEFKEVIKWYRKDPVIQNQKEKEKVDFTNQGLLKQSGILSIVSIILSHINMPLEQFEALPFEESIQFEDMARGVQRALVFESSRK